MNINPFNSTYQHSQSLQDILTNSSRIDFDVNSRPLIKNELVKLNLSTKEPFVLTLSSVETCPLLSKWKIIKLSINNSGSLKSLINPTLKTIAAGVIAVGMAFFFKTLILHTIKEESQKIGKFFDYYHYRNNYLFKIEYHVLYTKFQFYKKITELVFGCLTFQVGSFMVFSYTLSNHPFYQKYKALKSFYIESLCRSAEILKFPSSVGQMNLDQLANDRDDENNVIEPITLESIPLKTVCSPKNLLIGQYIIDVENVLKCIFNHPCNKFGAIHHPIENRYLFPIEQEKLLTDLAYLFGIEDKNLILDCWKENRRDYMVFIVSFMRQHFSSGDVLWKNLSMSWRKSILNELTPQLRSAYRATKFKQMFLACTHPQINKIFDCRFSITYPASSNFR